MSINPNDYVRIKLTEYGKRLIVEHIDQFNDDIRKRPGVLFRAKVPKWDDDGYLRDQFHTLMGYFGNCWGLGSHLPFTELEAAP